MKTFQVEANCRSCNATGIYVGFAERDGAGVVCRTCRGTGMEVIKISFEVFSSKKRRRKIERVYKLNAGICIGKGKGEFKLEDFGGMPYKDWFNGKEFPAKSENRMSTCPAHWYQREDYKRQPEWDECISMGSFRDCKHFKNRKKCWRKWDKENG